MRKISKDDIGAGIMILIVAVVFMCTFSYFKIVAEKYKNRDVHTDTE